MSEHPTRPAVREEIWDRFVVGLDRVGQAGNAADVLTPTALHPDAPSGKRFGDPHAARARQSRNHRAELWQARRRRDGDVAALPGEAPSTKNA
jgi:hypothetical protein